MRTAEETGRDASPGIDDGRGGARRGRDGLVRAGSRAPGEAPVSGNAPVREPRVPATGISAGAVTGLPHIPDDPPQALMSTVTAVWHTVSCVCRRCLWADEQYIAPEQLGWRRLLVGFSVEA